SASKPILRLEICPGFGLSGIRLRAVIVDPPGEGRQRHQDRFRPPARLQSEDRSAVIDQIVFDIPAASDQLKFALAFAVTVMAPEFDNGQISREESLARVLHESEKTLHIALQVIEEDPAHAARLVAMFDVEVLVAPLLEARVITGIVF